MHTLWQAWKGQLTFLVLGLLATTGVVAKPALVLLPLQGDLTAYERDIFQPVAFSALDAHYHVFHGAAVRQRLRALSRESVDVKAILRALAKDYSVDLVARIAISQDRRRHVLTLEVRNIRTGQNQRLKALECYDCAETQIAERLHEFFYEPTKKLTPQEQEAQNVASRPVWKAIKNSRSYQEFADFVQNFPHSSYVYLAEKKMHALWGTDNYIFRDALKSGGKGPKMVQIREDCYRPSFQKQRQCLDSFAIGQSEISLRDYARFAQMTLREMPNDEAWGDDSHPVIHVSWLDATAYTDWLSRQTGQDYRLATEAEWEYVANGSKRNKAAVNCFNCGDKYRFTAPTDAFAGNRFKVKNLLGNVREWTCSAFRGEKAANQCADERYQGARAIRGGSWFDKQQRVSATLREAYYPDSENYYLGFRVVRELAENAVEGK